jgi:hypothetical protein
MSTDARAALLVATLGAAVTAPAAALADVNPTILTASQGDAHIEYLDQGNE